MSGYVHPTLLLLEDVSGMLEIVVIVLITDLIEVSWPWTVLADWNLLSSDSNGTGSLGGPLVTTVIETHL